MSNSVTKLDKTHDKKKPEFSIQPHISSEKSRIFHLFFLGYDQNQRVEVVETEELDFEEIVQRLRRGESVFIKNKNPENIEFGEKLMKDGKDNSWRISLVAEASHGGI
jgi:hypothetical protein